MTKTSTKKTEKANTATEVEKVEAASPFNITDTGRRNAAGRAARAGIGLAAAAITPVDESSDRRSGLMARNDDKPITQKQKPLDAAEVQTVKAIATSQIEEDDVDGTARRDIKRACNDDNTS